MVKAKTKAKKGTDLARRGGLVPAIAKVAIEIRDLIETARSHVSVTANLALVNLYWNIGRIITQDIQKNEKRAEYGEQLLEGLSEILTQEYGAGYSRVNLQEMRRFYLAFQIRQTVSNESAVHIIRSTSSNESRMLQPVSSESSERIPIDFRRHFRLGWSHYRLLLSQGDPLRRQGENEPVGLILCTSARRQHVELLLRHGPHKMKVAEYLTRLPDKRLLEERLKIYSRLLQKGEA